MPEDAIEGIGGRPSADYRAKTLTDTWHFSKVLFERQIPVVPAKAGTQSRVPQDGFLLPQE